MTKFNYVTAWRKNDPKIERDVIDAWKANNILPKDVDPEKRVKEVCVVAYDGDKVAGISTIDINLYQPLRRRFGYFRAFTLPDYGRQDIARHMAVHCRDALSQWSRDNPKEDVAGMLAVYQAKGMGRTPVGFSGLTLIGYNSKNQQIRVVWFDHVTIDV